MMTRYRIASFDVRIPPATLRPTTRPVASTKSRIASAMTSANGWVAAGVILPVEVLMTSDPAAMAIRDARRTLSYVPSSPTSRIVFS